MTSPSHHGAHVPQFRNQQDKATGESSMIWLSCIIVIATLLLLCAVTMSVVRVVDGGLESIHCAITSPLQSYVSLLKGMSAVDVEGTALASTAVSHCYSKNTSMCTQASVHTYIHFILVACRSQSFCFPSTSPAFS